MNFIFLEYLFNNSSFIKILKAKAAEFQVLIMKCRPAIKFIGV
jgi:hypothetical protein